MFHKENIIVYGKCGRSIKGLHKDFRGHVNVNGFHDS